MSTSVRILTFGAVSGLVWSLIPSLASDKTPETFVMFSIAGIITGILLALTLYMPLTVSNKWITLLLGILALPAGAFCFGFCAWILDSTIGVHSPSGDGDVGPFIVGFVFAVGSMFTRLSFVLFPLSVVSIFLLRSAIRRRVEAPSESL